MFKYSDPTGGEFLGNTTARDHYRSNLGDSYDGFAKEPNSAITWLEAFDFVADPDQINEPIVEWRAFPISVAGSDQQIDDNRFRLQDEYVEWRVNKGDGDIESIEFVTEFPEYFEAFAADSADALIGAVQAVYPDGTAVTEELFGDLPFDIHELSPEQRKAIFRSNQERNPWNNGEKGILCLTQRFNTRNALFNLLSACGELKTQGTPEDTCNLVSGTGACGPSRSSDPQVCTLAQKARRAGLGFSPKDPAGIEIQRLDGRWKLDGNPIDINDPDGNEGIWEKKRGNHRAILKDVSRLTLDDNSIATGADVARRLIVGSRVLAVSESELPIWARTGEEGLRNLPDDFT